MKKVFITGATGFIGSAVTEDFLKNDIEVWAMVRPGFFERKNNSRFANLMKSEKLHLIENDLHAMLNLPGLVQEKGFDVFYHFAWEGMAGELLFDYKEQLGNVCYTLEAICAAAEMGCKKFVGSGSSSQLELTAEGGRECFSDKHIFFKTAKLSCEYMGEALAERKGIDFIWPILSNPYGPGETKPRLINSMIDNLMNGRHQPLSEGNQIYDFIYISDAAKAFRLLGEKGKHKGHYVLSMGNSKPLREFLIEVRNVVSPDAELGFGEMGFNGVYLPAGSLDNRDLVEDTGFIPDISFADGIRKTMEWIKERGN